jgi:hypothetical protein
VLHAGEVPCSRERAYEEQDPSLISICCATHRLCAWWSHFKLTEEGAEHAGTVISQLLCAPQAGLARAL